MKKLDELFDHLDDYFLEDIDPAYAPLCETELRRIHRKTMGKINKKRKRGHLSRRAAILLIAAVLFTGTVTAFTVTSLGQTFSQTYYTHNSYKYPLYQGLNTEQMRVVDEAGTQLNLKQTVGNVSSTITGILADSQVAIIGYVNENGPLHVIDMYYDDDPKTPIPGSRNGGLLNGNRGQGHFAITKPDFNRPITLKASLKDTPIEFHFSITKKAPEITFVEDIEENKMEAKSIPIYRNLSLSPVSFCFETVIEGTNTYPRNPRVKLKDGTIVPCEGFNGWSGDTDKHYRQFLVTLNLPVDPQQVQSMLIGDYEFPVRSID